MIDIAIAQFGEIDGIKPENAIEKGIHWYYFDETADRDFELRQLREHYRIVYVCYDKNYMERIK